MKLYQTAKGTSPRRVIIYLAEKGIDIPRHEVDIAGSEQKSLAFLALNPAGKVPVLELDDGSAISESAAIVEYLEEIYPTPPMIGTDPAHRGRVRALERISNDLITRSALWFLHSHPYFTRMVAEQQPSVAAAAQSFSEELLIALEAHIGERPFLAGDKPTIADCTLFAFFQTCRERFKVPLGADKPHLDAWYARFLARPSAAY